MPVDVVVVGAGPSGLSTAIRLKQMGDAAGTDLSIVVLEKAAEIGGHIVSGAVLDPAALDSLIPDWRQRGAPVTIRVSSDAFSYLTAKRRFPIPGIVLPKALHNDGNYIISLGDLCRWLAEQAEAMGIDVYPGIAASDLLYGEDGAVIGVATGDMGVDRNGQPKPSFAPGMDLLARYTVISEGAHGALAKRLIARFALAADSAPQKYGIGIKEIWEIDPARHRLGHVEHTLGWPLTEDTNGGGFIYHGADNTVQIGFVVHLNYSNPHLSPFGEMQRYKTHPSIRALLEGGKRVGYSARAMTSGGWQSIPRLAFPGGVLAGCSAGFMNLPRIKGIHNAMWSGIKSAEAIFAALQAGRGGDTVANLAEMVVDGPIADDLKPVRNAKPLLSRFGTLVGMGLIGLDLWCNQLFKLSPFGTLRLDKPDHATLRPARDAKPIHYPKPDGKLTFDRLSSVYLANISHDEDQPVHLRLRDPNVPVSRNLPLYDEPAQRYCPAGVYEIVRTEGEARLQINAANCVHCKTCDIKDPSQNIDWVLPEGGSGPNY
ncbi:electron transfer flavoprotein-ubiquinone oxidoreductase [Pelagibacterium lacus]|uniref:Electron transfer flavoprotein-ubiquinone oxidoreductase n=2 Tax=Pelagibacterium lacus TaxID=2282655 RepID=A0A369W556_9HYPH|nr:electron transfer flavoprotein-ubiquinone oxidoreductase [Pelagibacterium lacus]RDE09698.1 electron transfer flavoprotein-ubiquinone oxidoreductase [Pelagibacterium lacus]